MKAKTAESHEFLLNQKQKPQTVGVSGRAPLKGLEPARSVQAAPSIRIIPAN